MLKRLPHDGAYLVRHSETDQFSFAVSFRWRPDQVQMLSSITVYSVYSVDFIDFVVYIYLYNYIHLFRWFLLCVRSACQKFFSVCAYNCILCSIRIDQCSFVFNLALFHLFYLNPSQSHRLCCTAGIMLVYPAKTLSKSSVVYIKTELSLWGNASQRVTTPTHHSLPSHSGISSSVIVFNFISDYFWCIYCTSVDIRSHFLIFNRLLCVVVFIFSSMVNVRTCWMI